MPREPQIGQRRRLSALFGRVGKAARRRSRQMSSAFLPSFTSTPQSGIPQKHSYGSDYFLCTGEGGLRGHILRHAWTMSEESNSNHSKLSSVIVPTNTPQFQVPIAPPRHRSRTNRGVSLTSVPSNSPSHKSWYFKIFRPLVFFINLIIFALGFGVDLVFFLHCFPFAVGLYRLTDFTVVAPALFLFMSNFITLLFCSMIHGFAIRCYKNFHPLQEIDMF